MIREARVDHANEIVDTERIAREEVLSYLQAAFVSIGDRGLSRPEFHDVLADAWQIIKMGNGYLDIMTPWGKDKTNEDRAEVFGQVVLLLEAASFLLLPFMPDKMAELRRRIGVLPDGRGPLPAVFTLTPGEPLFPRYDPRVKA